MTAAERDEAGRAAWRTEVTGLPAATLVFIDESGTNRAMTPRYGRAPRGERAVGSAPRNHGPNVTLLTALTPTGMGPALVVEGAADRPAFETYVRQLLVPSLRPGQTVVLDNLSVHKSEEMRRLIEEAGCCLRFLPPYSPDFTPIEQAFAKIKHRLRQAAARTVDDLVAAIGEALDGVTDTDARGFFAHCGYPLPETT